MQCCNMIIVQTRQKVTWFLQLLIIKVFFFPGDHTTGVWVGGSDNGHVGRWAWFPTGD